MAQSFPMNGGDATCSYTNNSTMQRDGVSVVMDLIKEAVIKNLDIEKSSGSDFGSDSGSSLTRFVIADLGCSVGPNTFYAVQTLIEAVQQKYNHESDNTNFEYQVLFNDQIGNDFNTIFASLPHPRNYLAAGVSGSLYGRIFPSSSIHIAYSSYAMHWMSKVPEAMQAKDSPAWNAGKIHYVGASDAVMKDYSDQFEEDMEVFLRARAQEIVHGGLVMMIMIGVPHRDVEHATSQMYALIGSILMDMVEEGVLEQEKVDSFNIPIMFPCIKGVESVLGKNGCFEVVKMEIEDSHETVVMNIRPGFEGIISHHFGKQIFEEFFVRAMQKKQYITQISTSFQSGVTDLLFAVLKKNKKP